MTTIPSVLTAPSVRYVLQYRPPLWVVLHDYQTAKYNYLPRNGSPTPEVVPMVDNKTPITEAWQLYIRDINPDMTPEHVSAIFGNAKAFCNGTGFGDPNNPRADYILNENIGDPPILPSFDKVRTCGGAVHTGEVVGNELVLLTLNGNFPPPDIREINPTLTPWFFFDANIITNDKLPDGSYRVDPFPNGPTKLPLISDVFPVKIALSLVRRLGDAEPIPSAYNPERN